MSKPNVYRALFSDALYQILDNWVFRILCVLTLVPILFTFIVGFKQDEVSILFGAKTWEYDALLQFLGNFSGAGGVGSIDDAQGIVVAAFLGLVFDFLAGSIGVIFCIAATAFFVPRMIEKGAADVLFHKPLSRLVLYVSRYFAGLLYIVLLSVVMVGGIYLGLAVVSGYHDPGILTAAPTLTYFFGLLHAVSMLIGVITRSTVAAILLSILFFFGNGCIHQIWIGKEQLMEHSRVEKLTVASDDPDATEEELELEAEVSAEVEADDERGFFLTALLGVLDTLHYTLPKTTDASYIAKRMRKAVNKPDYRDDETAFAIYDLPTGMSSGDPNAIERPPVVAELGDLLGERRFAASGGGNTIGLYQRERRSEEYEIAGRTRTRRETLSRATTALEKVLASHQPEVDDERFGTSSRGSSLSASTFRWVEGDRHMSVTLFRIGEDVLTLVVADAQSTEQTVPEETLRGQLGQRSALDVNLMEKPDWYEDKLGFDAELKYNIFFSIGSSLAFTILMLGIGWWRLRRIDF